MREYFLLTSKTSVAKFNFCAGILTCRFTPIKKPLPYGAKYIIAKFSNFFKVLCCGFWAIFIFSEIAQKPKSQKSIFLRNLRIYNLSILIFRYRCAGNLIINPRADRVHNNISNRRHQKGNK